ncbi:hypothetical protein JB92DRAFT_2826033 [Gautieria morchelliformis]|nr:hypothetical protein JB92DRAFT_2826033 [Gautieria morchelliformis]
MLDKRDADAGHSKELVPQEAVTVIPEARQMESPDVLQGHEGKAMASEIEVQHSLPQPQFHIPRGDQQLFVPLPYSAGSQAHPSLDAVLLSVVQQSSPRVYMTLDSADVSSSSATMAPPIEEFEATQFPRDPHRPVYPTPGPNLKTTALPPDQQPAMVSGWNKGSQFDSPLQVPQIDPTDPYADNGDANARESESVERARVEHAATNKTRETRLSLAIDAAPEVGSALAAGQLPLIRLVKTTEGWKASAGALPHGKLRAQDTSGDGLATNHMGTQKTSNPKRKRSPEGVLAPADVGRRLRPRK